MQSAVFPVNTFFSIFGAVILAKTPPAMKLPLLLILLLSLVCLTACQPGTATAVKPGMIKVTILYPNGEGNTFDMDYYANKHMPMLADLLGDAMKFYSIDKGVAGRLPEDSAPYLAIGYLYFDELSAYRDAFGPHAETIVGDIPNYTNTQPVLQISEVLR